jgi:NiFe hydrogenase small subunit HydA
MNTNDPGRKHSFYGRLEIQGISRREFLRQATAIAVAMGMAPSFGVKIAEAFSSEKRPSIIYLNNAQCSGCTEALLRTGKPSFVELILEVISLDYSETLMAASGKAAEQVFRNAINCPGGYFCVIEGAIPTAAEGNYGHVGGRTMLEITTSVASRAQAVIAFGACANFGGIQAAYPNPTGAKGANEALADAGIKAINVAGCPPNPVNLVGTIAHLILHGMPQLDGHKRPIMFYGETVHDRCERLEHFHLGNFAPSLDSEEARKGWCLYKLGCKGPFTHNNCPTQLFNETNWPVRAGHPCIGCSEPGFWDLLSPFYERVQDARDKPSSGG